MAEGGREPDAFKGRMADKGGTGTDFFKLTVKVELLGKSKVKEHFLDQLQKAFQGHIASLRQHLQSYPELQSQHIQCVTNKKKYLGFEFWLRSAEALEQLKLATENDRLVNALSDFSEKKAMGLDIGLGSQHLCFKCKIERKQYKLGQAHFMDSSGESSTEEEDDQQKQSHEPQGAASGTEPKEKQEITGKAALQQDKSSGKSFSPDWRNWRWVRKLRKNMNELEGAQDVLLCPTVEEVVMDQQKLTGNEGALDVSSTERGPQIETTQTLSGHGGGEVNTSSAAPPQTGSSVDVASSVQMDQPGSADKPVSKESGFGMFRKLAFWKDKSETKANQRKNMNELEGAQDVLLCPTVEEVVMDQQKLTGNEGALDVSSTERGPQIETTQTLSGHGGGEVNTSSAAPPQTGSSVDVASSVQMDQPGSADKPVSKESGFGMLRKLVFWKDKSETNANQRKNMNELEGAQDVLSCPTVEEVVKKNRNELEETQDVLLCPTVEEVVMDQQKLTGNEGALDVSSTERGPQIETTQTLSGHGGGEVNTSSAAPPQTGSSVDVASSVQMDQPGSADKPVSKEAGFGMFRKLAFWKGKSETKANQVKDLQPSGNGSNVDALSLVKPETGESPDGSNAGAGVIKTPDANVTQTDSLSDKVKDLQPSGNGSNVDALSLVKPETGESPDGSNAGAGVIKTPDANVTQTDSLSDKVKDLQPSANGSNVDALSLVKPETGESPDGSNAGAGVIKTPDANVTQTDSLSDKVKDLQPSANGSNVDALSLVKPETGESPDGSNAGAGVIKTPDANVTQTDSLSDKVKDLQPSANGSNVDALSLVKPETGESPDGSNAGAGVIKTPDANVTQTDSLSDKVKDLQPSANGSNVDALSLVKPETGESPDGSNAGTGVIKTPDANVTQTDSLSDKGFEKQLHIYIPWKFKDIVKVSARNIQQDKETEVTFSQSDDEYLWISSLKNDQPYKLPSKYQFEVSIIYLERNVWGMKIERTKKLTWNLNFTSSPVVRLLWCDDKYTPEIVTHLTYILKNCLSDLRCCIIQTEEFLHFTSALDLQTKKSIIDGIKLDLLSDYQQILLFAVMVAILATGENKEFIKNIETLLSTKKMHVLEKLIHAFNILVLTDIPSTCVENLKKLSFWVFKEHYGKSFCLLKWREEMPILDDADFICYLEQGLKFTNQEDKESVRSIRDICLQTKDKILKHDSGVSQKFLSNMLKQLSVPTHLNMYKEMFYGDQSSKKDLRILGEKFKQSLMKRIEGCAIKYKKERSIEKVKCLWYEVKTAGLGSEQVLISTFEDNILGLWNESTSGHDGTLGRAWCALCEDDILFASGKHQQNLLHNMAKAKRKAMHNYMLKLALLEKFKTSVDSYTVHLWYCTALDEHITSRWIQDRLVLWYDYLGRALSLLEATSIRNQEVTCKLSKSLFKKITAGTLNASDHLKCADKILQMTNYKEVIIPIFMQHALQLLDKNNESQNPVEILESICRKELSLAENWQAKIVITLMKMYAPRGKSAQEQVLSMVPHHAFWTTVFRLHGNLHHKVSKENVFQLTVDSLAEFRNLLKDFTVQVACIEGISSEMEDHVAALLKTESFRREEGISAIRRCKQHLNTVKEDVKIVKQTIASVLKFYPMARVELSDVEIRLEKIEKALQSPSISLNELDKLWAPYHDLPKICKKLVLPVTSKVFWIKHKELEMEKPHLPQNLDGNLSKYSSLDSGKEKRKEDEIKDNSDVLCQLPKGIPFLTQLSDKCCELYTKFWDDFIKGIDVNLLTIQKTFETKTDIPSEIQIIERYVRKDLNKTSKAALLHWKDFHKYKNCVKAMKSSMAAFDVHIDNDDALNNSIAAFESLVNDTGSLNLFESHEALITVEKASTMLSLEAVTVLKRFGKSADVIDFLKEIFDEDPRNLIDAVEELSENYVKESTVSGLIDVKRFLDPFIGKDCLLRENPQSFFHAFDEKLKSFENLDLKIKECMNNIHGLKSLYQNLANRSEMTREIMKSILEQGNFLFILENHKCSLTVKYNEGESKYSKSRLVDLRSRALLLMNTARKDNTLEEFGDRQELLKGFVTYIDLGLEIADMCTSLHVAGHIHYIKFMQTLKKESLNEYRLKLKSDLESWYEEIKQSREEYYFLNFLNGGQIQSLFEYLHGHDENEQIVDTFLKFIHPQARVEGIQDHFKGLKSDTSNKSVLMNMGKTLDQAFKIAICLAESAVPVTGYVQNRKVRIALLEEENNESVVKTVLGLYQSSSKLMPEAHQVLFCQQETTWDEVELLLQRCLGAPKVQQCDSLFCLANTEMLSNEIQFQLVNSIHKLPNDRPFCLALVFRGPRHHSFLHEFSEFVISVQPMADDLLQTYLHQNSRIFTITSQIPGLGKTEYVKRYSHENRKNHTTFHVSGPVRKQTLVERLSKLNIKTGSVLHIDVGNTPNTKELDIFMFELLVLKYVSAYNASVFLTTDTVCIEIANTMNNTLPNSLPIVTSFKRIHLDWEGFETLQISCELYSPVQVVCHYLNKLENGTLDKRDLLFKGTKKLDPLPPEKCRELLERNIRFKNNEVSYTLINNFVHVLADQLKKMSCSDYFRKSRLSLMLGSRKDLSVKTDLVKAMVDLSVEFTDRPIKTCKEFQTEASKGICPTISFADRMEGMIRWNDSNHLVILFHSQDIQTLTALYRDISKVPDYIRFLFEKQMKKDLPNFEHMSQKDLQNILVRVARSNQQCMQEEDLKIMAEYYALTPDNLLKMVLIMLRIRAHVPVILMGETGCGKTSLIQYLSKICDVEFNIISIHAGLEEGDIIRKVTDVNKKAFELMETNRQVWLFLDEINTNDQMWLLSDIVCHHSLLGKKLAPNLVLMAACNPYRLRSKAVIHTAGLKRKAKVDQLSRLVYRVHPLPETMIDYVWDFGSLSKSEEKLYIKQMVCGKLKFAEKKEKLLVSALLKSQEFIRKVEKSSYHVSLRDVRRCKDLSLWFKQILIKKKEVKDANNIDSDITDEIETRAIVLALAHCYHSRLTDSTTRKNYREALCASFKKHLTHEFKEADINKIIREEQKDILDRMELPPGTAKNSALQENVFVILVCILSRIPVFVVGKPGCSKSLSMQVIKETLKGRGSKNEFFQSLPQLYCVSFQGSESSTSDGIAKVFKTAQNYQDSNFQNAVQTVVILDEVGLAEVSRFNPLKILHSLMEPTEKPYPDVAFVGISNWALDASKMNRAIYLSRPEMDWEELSYTGQAISDSLIESSKSKLPEDWNLQEELDGIVEGYIKFVSNQSVENFYGLRDYYSLVKYFVGEVIKLANVEVNQAMKGQIILKGISINFGGQPSEFCLVMECFKKHVKALRDLHGCQKFTVLDLIKENLEDRSARHLMLITTGDSALGILEKQLKELNRDYLTIFGSKFEEDLTDDYSYRILSQIILCMEQGLVLILKDLETMYGSLYDMLNQNYKIVRKKKNCRIALGPYSNPICHVHDNFRCVVLVEESELCNSDPPFLNRFEKQYLQYFEVMDDENKNVMSCLEHWIKSITSVPEKHFSSEDIFPIYSKNMIPSLVLHVSSDLQSYSPTRTKFEACKFSLLEVMKPEAVIRLSISEYGQTCLEEEIKNLQQTYFKLPIHNGLTHFLKSEIREDKMDDGKMIIVFTNSNIHIDLNTMVQDLKCQIEKLGTFRAEKQLFVHLEHFWQDPEKKVLFLQCKADTDAEHVLLAMSMIEKSHSVYHQKNPLTLKHVCLIVHLDRHAEKAKTLPQINFLVKWKLALLDSLEEPPTTLPDFMKMDLVAAVQKKRPLNKYIMEKLTAAFTCIRYGTNGRDNKGISDIVYKIQSNPDFLLYLDTAVMAYIKTVLTDEESLHWQRYASCDAIALYIASTFINVLERYIFSAIYDVLAMVIYELEKNCLLDSFFVQDSSQRNRQQMWQELSNDKKLFPVHKLPLPKGPECYIISTPVVKLHMPFSRIFFEKMEEERGSFCEFLRIFGTKYDIEEIEKLDNKKMQTLQNLYSQTLSFKFEEVIHLEYENWQLDYVHDFCTLVVTRHFPNNVYDTRINIMQWLFTRKSDIVNASLVDASIMVHTAYWTNPELIMNQFMLIEICRELVDMSDILPTSFTPYEAKQWKKTNTDGAQSDEIEGFKGRGRHENPTNLLHGKYNFTYLESGLVSVDEKDVGQPDNPNKVSASECDLVDIVCKRMLQSSAVLRSKTDLKLWNNDVQNILSIAGRISSECSVLYGLRFCSDLTSLILVPYNMGSSCLVRFGNLLLEKQNVQDSELCAIVDDMLNSSNEIPIKTEDKQKILSQFVIRNLQSAEDSADIMEWLLAMIERSHVPDPQLSYLKKPLHYALYLEMDESEDKSENVFCQIIEKDSSHIVEENKFLDRLNICIKNLWPKCKHVFPLATLLVDIFEQDIFGLFIVQFKDVNIEYLKRAERIICKEEFSLEQLLAIAYYRKCLKIMAVTLQNDDTDLSETILKTLDACLINHRRDVELEKKMSLQLFFLKVLKAGCGFNNMQKKCKTLTDRFSFLSTVLKGELVTDSADTLPLPIHYTELYKAALQALDEGKNEFRDFVNEAIIDDNKMLMLHSVCIQKFYLKRSVMGVTDSTRNMANYIKQLCQESEMDEYNKKCIKCYLGSEFAIPKLNLHEGSDDRTIQVALLISELSSLALSKRANSNFFVKCIIHPQELSETLVPGIEDRDVRYEFTSLSLTPEVLVGRCSNHHRFAVSKYDGVHHDCSLCCSPVLEKDMLQIKEYIVLNPITKELIIGRNLTTVSQSVLQIIIYCLCAASLALEYSNQDDIERVLKEETHDIGEYLFSKIESNIKVLEAMIGFKQTELDYFLSNLFHTAQDLIWKDSPSFMNKSERNEWERKFTDVVSTVVQERFTVVCKAKKQVMSLCNLDGEAVEYQIQEIDEVGWCPYLFRLTREPSLANLSLEMYEKNKAGSFRFLALVLRSLPQLELIQHIRPLISWHKACVMYASYKKKADFEKPKYSVSAFIHEDKDEKRQKDLYQKFESCKTALEALKKKEGLVKDLPKMESIHIGSPLESCIIMNKDSPMYKLLDILVCMQNTFLDETLALSVSCDIPALTFLQKHIKNSSCACFPCIPLADVRKGNIIAFESSDNELKFSQCNLLYGQGQDIAYDLQTIEMELANSLLLGKSYILLEYSFPRIIFSDELYMTYVRMIQELKRNIPQKKLPVNIEKELRDKKNQDPEQIADLLTHLGVIISFLRRTRMNPETPLVKVIDHWDHVHTHSFSKKLLQSLDNDPSLCHIVELNELLEELNADGIIGSLDNKYRVPLEDSSKNTMNCFDSITVTEVVLKAEKRFVHRCLHDNELADTSSMLSYMSDEYFWPAESLKNGCLVIDGQQQEYPLMDIFPENILVRHVHAHIEFLTHKIMDLEAMEQTSRTVNKAVQRNRQRKAFNMKT